jgi:hypothetical protein
VIFILQKPKDDVERSRAIGRVVEALEELPHGQVWRVSIEEHRRARSHPQNAYYWGVVIKAISDATGFESEECHEYMCGTVFGWKDKRVPKTPRNPQGFESVPVRTTTTDADGRRSVLGAIQFSEFVEAVRRFAAMKMQVNIPDPDQEQVA